MINPYNDLPEQLKECLLTKDGRIVGQGVTLSRGNINGKFFYMVESNGKRTILNKEALAINEFINASKFSKDDALQANDMALGNHDTIGYGGDGGEDSDDEEKTTPFASIDSETVDRSNLQQAMEKNDLTVTKLAERTGVQPPAISRLLRTPKKTAGGDRDPGGRNPSITVAADIARQLNTSVEILFPDLFKPKKSRKRKGNRKSGQASKMGSSDAKGLGLYESIDGLFEDINGDQDFLVESIAQIIMCAKDHIPSLAESILKCRNKNDLYECRNSLLSCIVDKHIIVDKSSLSPLNGDFISKIGILESFVDFLRTIPESKGLINNLLDYKRNLVSEEYADPGQTLSPTAEQGMASNSSSNMTAGDVAKAAIKKENDPQKLVKEIEKAKEKEQEDQNKRREERAKQLEAINAKLADMKADLDTEQEQNTNTHKTGVENVDDMIDQISGMIDDSGDIVTK